MRSPDRDRAFGSPDRRAERRGEFPARAAAAVPEIAAVAAPTTPWGAAPVQSIGPRRGKGSARRSVDNSARPGLAVDNRR
jgi:adenosylcobinamide-phosphate synthase